MLFYWDNAEITSVHESREFKAILSSALAESQSALKYNHMTLLMTTRAPLKYSDGQRILGVVNVEHDSKIEGSEI